MNSHIWDNSTSRKYFWRYLWTAVKIEGLVEHFGTSTILRYVVCINACVILTFDTASEYYNPHLSWKDQKETRLICDYQ